MTPTGAKKVLIVGNPNVGKSLVFSRCTGVNVISSNYPGTTVALKIGRVVSRGREYELVDMPGLYSLDQSSAFEQSMSALIEECDIIINVIDATTLERNLNLTLQLLHRNKPIVVCLNIWDETAHKGISIDHKRLAEILGVPVVTASALSGDGITGLVSSLSLARTGTVVPAEAEIWQTIGSIINRVQRLSHRHHTFLEQLGDLTLHRFGGPLFALLVLVMTFWAVRFIGEHIINRIGGPLFTLYYQPFLLQLCSPIPFDVLREILVGRSLDPLQSFGILTTGVYIALVLVFPYFVSFYLLLGIMEDVGYLPRLAVVLDALFHRLGLHGYSSIPVMLGLGCKVPAILATRTLTGRREKVLTIALIMMSAPCLPQSAMIFSMGMRYGAGTVLAIFLLLFLFSILMNAFLNRIAKGETPELFMEIPGYRWPRVSLLARKLWTRVLEYAGEVFPMIVVGVCIIHILDALHILTMISNTVGRPLSLLLGLPREIASVMLLGFLRKDVSIALLAPFNLSAGQFVIASIFMVLYLPCIAAFFTLVKEVRLVTTLKIIGLVLCSAIVIGTAMNGVIRLLNKIF